MNDIEHLAPCNITILPAHTKLKLGATGELTVLPMEIKVSIRDYGMVPINDLVEAYKTLHKK